MFELCKGAKHDAGASGLGVLLQILEHKCVGSGAGVSRAAAAFGQLTGPLIGGEVVGRGRTVTGCAGLPEASLAGAPEGLHIGRECAGRDPPLNASLCPGIVCNGDNGFVVDLDGVLVVKSGVLNEYVGVLENLRRKLL